jgi:CheY-like chemotaxis protein
LHVDDDPLMRDVVELSLGLDPTFTLLTCASGEEALAQVVDWAPDLILCDYMMPDMEGPAVLARLQENTATSKIPVMFMTARAEAPDLDQLKSLGAVGVIAKPFEPATLAGIVRGQLQTIRLAAAGYNFAERLSNDAATLSSFRQSLRDHSDISLVPDGLESCVHKLAGAAGVFNMQDVSRSASALEQAIIARRSGHGAPGAIETNLDALLDSIERE